MSQRDELGEHEWAVDDTQQQEGHGASTGSSAEVTSMTGVSAVDDVVASVQGLDQRPVEEHVAVFEQAHERLRRALDVSRDG